MTTLLSVVMAIGVLGWCGHRVLHGLSQQRVDPTILLTGWLVSTVGIVVATMSAAIGVAFLPLDGHHQTSGWALAGECWSALSSGSLPGGAPLVAGSGVVITAFVLARLVLALRTRLRLRRLRAPQMHQLRLLAAHSRKDEPVWVQDERPIALSIGGRSGLILMSQTVRERLTPAALDATLEHERAHLHGRHHLLLALVETLAVALPWIPLLRSAPAATRDLVELAADSRAARRCGPAAVREALCNLAGHRVPVGGLAMAGRLARRASSGSARGASESVVRPVWPALRPLPPWR